MKGELSTEIVQFREKMWIYWFGTGAITAEDAKDAEEERASFASPATQMRPNLEESLLSARNPC